MYLFVVVVVKLISFCFINACGSPSKESSCNEGDLDSIPGLGDPLEKEMATHTSILAWRILWTEEPQATVLEVAKNWI